jgi:hypothetical protein
MFLAPINVRADEEIITDDSMDSYIRLTKANGQTYYFAGDSITKSMCDSLNEKNNENGYYYVFLEDKDDILGYYKRRFRLLTSTRYKQDSDANDIYFRIYSYRSRVTFSQLKSGCYIRGFDNDLYLRRYSDTPIVTENKQHNFKRKMASEFVNGASSIKINKAYHSVWDNATGEMYFQDCGVGETLEYGIQEDSQWVKNLGYRGYYIGPSPYNDTNIHIMYSLGPQENLIGLKLGNYIAPIHIEHTMTDY